MISTVSLIASMRDVPIEWIFEYYLNLNEKLTGQNIKLCSIFSSKDKVPSMFIYYDVTSGTYKFKDFSSGYQGDHVELVKLIFNYNDRNKAVYRIMTDYSEFITNNAPREELSIQVHDKFKVTDYEIRHWNTVDAKYWQNYFIGSPLLEQYNVYPLKFFEMSRNELDGSTTVYNFTKELTYGYFRNDGTLYKIYTPTNSNKKFIKVQNYIQGIEQLTLQTKYLIITSSLKDLLAFNKLGINNIEGIAPDSENSMVPESIMIPLAQNYQKVIVLFDNDQPGIDAAMRYKVKYGYDYVLLPMSKDISDSVKDYGIEKVRETLFPLLKQVI